MTAPFWLTPAAYLIPAHFPTSAWWTHAPFASWLVDALRPMVVVELGTHYGYSAFAFAEAGKRLDVPMTVYALDTWRGDDHAGFYEDDVFDYVRTTAREDYADRVQLFRGYFSESRARFAKSSVDLLHIDGRHAYEDVLEDFTEWVDTVRDGGIVLFHDIAERDNGFGVWRLWEEVSVPGRSFAFDHGHGLGVLSIGKPQPALRALFEADAATAAGIRADFAHLGDVCAKQGWLLSLPVELEQVREVVRAQAENGQRQHDLIEDLHARLGLETEHVAALMTSTSWRVTGPLRTLGRLLRRG
ncbi:class I SAM-dependent methyltransferase [Microbacterium pygmaeum]|uniref:Methyltransferase domain-containing protein n=1 Tax=Microbacterium pygmaeum TaxID=370764 RepID=A0A1G8CRJ4_9MICO|nr:class I SAM-dependent methyltransferase [Microbacterium pygmaeum]SDH47550.1 Methyltransferase domain-containing protein [Microbacterium pygmaeum]